MPHPWHLWFSESPDFPFGEGLELAVFSEETTAQAGSCIFRVTQPAQTVV